MLREQIFRERQEKVAHLDAITKLVARVFNLDARRVFGDITRDYAREVFQETYDAELLRKKLEELRRAQERVRAKRREDLRQIDRLERMGQYYDKVMGALPFEKKQPQKPQEIPQGPKPIRKPVEPGRVKYDSP